MTTATLLVGHYHGLLLESIDADMLCSKLRSAGLLTAHEQMIISSSHSVYHKNWLLLEHVRHMSVPALVKFCELVQNRWPQIGSQLIAGSYVYSMPKHTVCSYTLYSIYTIY